MNFSVIGNLISKVSKHAPDLLTGLGIGLGVVSTIEACKATRKLDPVLDEHKHNMTKIREFYEDKPDEESERRAAVTKQYAETGTKLVKLYLPSALLAGTGIACILGANHMLNQKVAGLTTAYTALSTAFGNYRERVAEAVGKEKEEDLYFNRHDEEIVEVVTDENGNEKTVVHTTKVYDGEVSDMVFTRIFANEFTQFADDRDPFANKLFLSGVEDRLNSLGKSRCRMYGVGVVTFNEALDYLGYKPVDYGYTIGWRFYENPKLNPYGDNYISLGLDDVRHNTEFINESEGRAYLSFNVDKTPLDIGVNAFLKDKRVKTLGAAL